MRFFDDATIPKIRQGYYSAVYFNRTKAILLDEKNTKTVTMQVFQRHERSVLCGAEEVKELLKVGTGYYENNSNHGSLRLRSGFTPRVHPEGQARITNHGKEKWIDMSDSVRIEALKDGDLLTAGEPVMHIMGPYAYFVQLESVYLGILARRTVVATNIARSVAAALRKHVLFFADRFDSFLNQVGDGYAAKVGGAFGVCTEAMTVGFGKDPLGTIPHSLIALHGGDTVAATHAFAHRYPDVPLIALVDFDNDCVGTSLAVAKSMGKRLWGVRLDTAGNMTDISLESQKSKIKNQKYGVNPMLVRLVRQALNDAGFPWVKIVVSGGFTHEKIAAFEKEKTPADIYAVGSAMLKGENDFTADIVLVDGKPMAKKGREYQALCRR